MRIGIIGAGVVGAATARAFQECAEVRVHDRLQERSTHSRASVLACDLVFVCLPTPQEKGSLACDTGAVEDFFSSVAGSTADFVLRSTVPIGTTWMLASKYDLPNLVHSPEFLTARTAVEDAAHPTRLIIGWPDLKRGSLLLWNLYQERFPDVPLLEMTSHESEAVKLFCNSFYAVKVGFFKEIRGLADRLALDWERVHKAMLAGGWINPMHTQVPGPDGQRGFGGACLPKDLANLSECLLASGCPAGICLAALTYRNDR